MTAVLGDFLGPAGEHIARATSGWDDLPAAEPGPVVAELGRVIAALGRYLGDVALPDEARPQALQNASPQATARTRQALRRSALILRQAAETLDTASPPGTGRAAVHPAAAHLAAAASQLAAGHDLLLDRRATGPARPADLGRGAGGPVLLGRRRGLAAGHRRAVSRGHRPRPDAGPVDRSALAVRTRRPRPDGAA